MGFLPRVARDYVSRGPLAIVGILLLAGCGQAVAQVSHDERVLLFPAAASPTEDGNGWIVPVHAWIFEPEDDDWLRSALVDELGDELGIDPETTESPVFQQRVRYLLRDNERGKQLQVRIAGGPTATLTPTGADGHAFGEIRLSRSEANRAAVKGWLEPQIVLSSGDAREFEGRIELIPPDGVSVISDIDDTIKDSGVTDPRRLARSTFLEPFRPVEGMAERYACWREQGASFHYVSSSPWQLYEPLAAFMETANFPRGAFHLKRFRPKDESAVALFASPLKSKPPVIAAILDAWPQRTFVLVGDSGEKDPEVYGEIARRYGNRIVAIYIRDVTGETADAERYREAFRGVPRAKWRLFTAPATLPDLPEQH